MYMFGITNVTYWPRHNCVDKYGVPVYDGIFLGIGFQFITYLKVLHCHDNTVVLIELKVFSYKGFLEGLGGAAKKYDTIGGPIGLFRNMTVRIIKTTKSVHYDFRGYFSCWQGGLLHAFYIKHNWGGVNAYVLDNVD